MIDVYDLNLEEIVKEMYYSNCTIVARNRGNTGFFVKQYDDYRFVTKGEIIKYICRKNNIDDERMIKLILLKLKMENER